MRLLQALDSVGHTLGAKIYQLSEPNQIFRIAEKPVFNYAYGHWTTEHCVVDDGSGNVIELSNYSGLVDDWTVLNRGK